MFAGLRLGLVVTVLGFSMITSAQRVLPGPQTGTIQALGQDEGFLTISGTNYEFDNEITIVVVSGEQIDSADLDVGMVVSYTINAQGILTRLEIIGPRQKILLLESN